jgi:tetratricopeptide (TPR) repeat protein
MSPGPIDGNKATKVFLSYSRRDRNFVSRLADALEQQPDIEVFRDTDDILPTEEWKERLESLIGQADTIVFALSPHSAKSEVCGWEVDYATSLNKRIAPIVIRDVAPDTIPASLSKYNYIFFTNRRDFDASIGNLIAALNMDIDWIREHTRIWDLARRWKHQGRQKSQFLRGQDLLAAEAWIAGQPGNAPAPTAVHREFVSASRRGAVRRQQYWFGGSLAASVIMAIVSIFAFQQRNAAVEAEMLAAQRADSERAAKEDAERALTAATETASTLIQQLAGEFRDSGVPIATTTRILEAARRLLETLSERAASNAELQGTTADAYQEIAETLLRQGDADAARLTVSAAITILRRLHEVDPEEQRWRLRLSRSLARLADSLFALGQFSEAQEAAAEAAAGLRDLIHEYPDETQWQGELAVFAQRNALAALVSNQFDEARAILLEGLEAGRRAMAEFPDDVRYHGTVASTLTMLGAIRMRFYEYVTSIAAYDEALSIYSELSEGDPENIEWRRQKAETLKFLGQLHRATGELDEARTDFLAAAALFADLALADPDDDRAQVGLAGAHEDLASIAVAQGNHEEALREALAGLEVRQSLATSNPANYSFRAQLAQSHATVASAYQSLGQIDSALASHQLALTVLEQLAADERRNEFAVWDLTTARFNLGKVHLLAGNLSAADQQFTAALLSRERLVEANASNTVWLRELSVLHGVIGGLRARQGNTAAAIESYRSALGIADRLVETDESQVLWLDDKAYYADHIAKLNDNAGNLEEAAEAYRRMLSPLERLAHLFPDDEERWRTLYLTNIDLAEVQARRGDYHAALEFYHAALAIQATHVGAASQQIDWQHDLLITHKILADLVTSMGNTDQAIEHRRAVVDLSASLIALEPSSPARHERRLQALLSLAELHFEQQDEQKALEVFLEAAALGDDPGTVGLQSSGVQQHIANAHIAAAGIVARMGDVAAALEHHTQALVLREFLLALEPTDSNRQFEVAQSLNFVAWGHQVQGQYGEALPAIERSVDMLRQLVGNNDALLDWRLRLARALTSMGEIHRGMRSNIAALGAFDESTALFRALLAEYPNSSHATFALSDDLNKIAEVRISFGNSDEALAAYQESAEVLGAYLMHTPGDLNAQYRLAVVLQNTGDAYSEAGDGERAHAVYLGCLALREELLRLQPDNANWQYDLAVLHWRLAFYADAPGDHWQAVVDILARLDASGLLSTAEQDSLATARAQLAEALAGATAE